MVCPRLSRLCLMVMCSRLSPSINSLISESIEERASLALLVRTVTEGASVLLDDVCVLVADGSPFAGSWSMAKPGIWLAILTAFPQVSLLQSGLSRKLINVSLTFFRSFLDKYISSNLSLILFFSLLLERAPKRISSACVSLQKARKTSASATGSISSGLNSLISDMVLFALLSSGKNGVPCIRGSSSLFVLFVFCRKRN